MMVKRLNIYGKLLHLFTAFFPIYVYWAYLSFTKIQSWSIKNVLQIEYIGFILLTLLAISSILVFYFILAKRRKNPDKEFNVKSSNKQSAHIRYVIGALSPFMLFITEFMKDIPITNTGAIVGTISFIIMGVILIFKEDTGILYNLFYLRYNILNVKTKEDINLIIITTKESLTNHVKVNQLDKKVFKEWT